MKLEWLGQYRNFFESLFFYTNTYGQIYSLQGFHHTSVPCSLAELQMLEYIIENEDKNQKMVQIAYRLGVPPATFSKNVKKMVAKKLLNRYQSTTNKKEIIVRASPLGKSVYEEYVHDLVEMRFKETFQILDRIPPQYIDDFSEIFRLNADSMIRQLQEMREEKKQKAEPAASEIQLIQLE